MSALDWSLFGAFIGFVIWDGARRGRQARTAEDYLLAGRAMPWWAMGLSVMATQASAITMVGTTGKGFEDGTRFVQFYYALPLAMVLLCVTAVPLFHRLRVFTAYEYLEQRFDRRTRTLCGLTFLVLRCLSLGVILAAASVVLSVLFEVSLVATVIPMGLIAVAYTALGGLQAVIATDVKQMVVMVAGLIAIVVCAFRALPDAIGVAEAWQLADVAGRLEFLDVTFDPEEPFNLWSSLLGATFLFLAYFGTDQSQVQRYLAGKSLRDKRQALMLNAVLKVPFQLLVLFVGVLLFLWSLYDPTPVVFERTEGSRADANVAGHRAADERYRGELASAGAAGLDLVQAPDAHAREQARDRFEAHLKSAARTRHDAATLRKDAFGEEARSDANHVMPWFLFHRLPAGIAGLILAAMFAAALSSVDSELNSLATVTVIDVLRMNPDDPAQRATIVRASRLMTVLAGVLASCFALYVAGRGALIVVVNEVGSLFYGALLGVFVLALFDKKAHGRGAVFGLLSGITTVAVLSDRLAFLWQNTLGTVTAVVVGSLVSRVWR